jgi:hypothetical protein
VFHRTGAPGYWSATRVSLLPRHHLCIAAGSVDQPGLGRQDLHVAAEALRRFDPQVRGTEAADGEWFARPDVQTAGLEGTTAVIIDAFVSLSFPNLNIGGMLCA